MDEENIAETIMDVIAKERTDNFAAYMPNAGTIRKILMHVDDCTDDGISDGEPGLIGIFAETAMDAFRYGFAQGQKAAKNGKNMYN